MLIFFIIKSYPSISPARSAAAFISMTKAVETETRTMSTSLKLSTHPTLAMNKKREH